MDYLAFERRLLRLMFQTSAPLTPVHVAYFLDLPVAEAKAHLDRMVEAAILELDSDEHGHMIYAYGLRPPVEKLPEPARPKRRRRAAQAGSVALSIPPTPPLPPTVANADDRRYSPAAAAALSLFLPGVGQIYSGRVPQGIGWMLATGLGYLLFLVPGLILHICCIVNAAAVPTQSLELARNP